MERNNPFFGNKKFRTSNQKYITAVYDPFILKRTEVLSIAEQRAEYSRLRSIAIKRLERLGSSKYKTAPMYIYNKDKFVSLKEIKTDSQLAYKLSDVARFLRMETSTISGLKKQERKVVEAMSEKGIAESELSRFGEFMELARTMLTEFEYDSDELVKMYKNARDRGNLDASKQIIIRWRARLNKEGRRKDKPSGKNRRPNTLSGLGSSMGWTELP